MAITIVKGEDTTITVRLDDAVTKDPFDLTGATVLLEMDKTDGTNLSIAGTIAVPATSGKCTFTMTDIETGTLTSGTVGMEVIVDIGTDRRIVQFPSSILVKERIV